MQAHFYKNMQADCNISVMNITIKRICDLLEKDGVSRRQYRRKLESITGLSYSAIAQWFSGDTKEIEYKNLKKIADHYNVNVDYLMGLENDPESIIDTKLSILVARCKELGIDDEIADQIELSLKLYESKR